MSRSPSFSSWIDDILGIKDLKASVLCCLSVSKRLYVTALAGAIHMVSFANCMVWASVRFPSRWPRSPVCLQTAMVLLGAVQLRNLLVSLEDFHRRDRTVSCGHVLVLVLGVVLLLWVLEGSYSSLVSTLTDRNHPLMCRNCLPPCSTLARLIVAETCMDIQKDFGGFVRYCRC
jgi:hypothetical protein